MQQSLTLWREVANDMFRLWCLAEEDLLRAEVPYELRDTGQGLQRVQAAVQTSQAVHALLHKVQSRAAGGWVGSSLIHLGDSNVPNALLFIDKYSQVEHILNPILRTIDALKELHREPHLGRWIDSSFGGVQRLRDTILCALTLTVTLTLTLTLTPTLTLTLNPNPNPNPTLGGRGARPMVAVCEQDVCRRAAP